jgi:hypothetical protein
MHAQPHHIGRVCCVVAVRCTGSATRTAASRHGMPAGRTCLHKRPPGAGGGCAPVLRVSSPLGQAALHTCWYGALCSPPAPGMAFDEDGSHCCLAN